jgi:hypothetical protein
VADLSYHDLHVTTAKIPRSRLFGLPYGIQLICNRVSGWNLWQAPGDDPDAGSVLLGGEYDGRWLVLDVAGHVILDSRKAGT